jgi:probable rRNA maturation factor
LAVRELEVDITDATGRLARARQAWLTDQVRKAAQVMGLRGSIRVRIVDDRAMADLHGRHLGDPTTTDVLTFDLATEKHEKVGLDRLFSTGIDRSLIGIDSDIYACLDEADRESQGAGYAVERELLLYVVHGVLHCLGWEDHPEASAAQMHDAEDRVLLAIGVGPVYGRNAGAEPGGSETQA